MLANGFSAQAILPLPRALGWHRGYCSSRTLPNQLRWLRYSIRTYPIYLHEQRRNKEVTRQFDRHSTSVSVSPHGHEWYSIQPARTDCSNAFFWATVVENFTEFPTVDITVSVTVSVVVVAMIFKVVLKSLRSHNQTLERKSMLERSDQQSEKTNKSHKSRTINTAPSCFAR